MFSGFNPLHCGAVVASTHPAIAQQIAACRFQSPSLRGSGRFLLKRLRHILEAEFQSPSLRGSGRFTIIKLAAGWDGRFQSPSLRGSGRFTSAKRYHRLALVIVSIPFIAGQWSLPEYGETVIGKGVVVSIPFIAGQWSLRMCRITL